MRHFAVMSAFGALLVAAPAQADLLVNVSKSQQRLSVMIDGAEAYRWPVSTGRKGFATPSGTYRPTRLERHWYSHKYEMSPMPWSVFFYRGYAVHGTMETYNLGHAASHGCVRLRPDNASILFTMVKRYGAAHTKVVVMDGPLPQVPRPGGEPVAQAPQPAAGVATVEANALSAQAESKSDTSDLSEHLSAKTHSAESLRDAGASAPKPAGRTQVASLARLSHSVGSDTQVLREREAWLRAIDRKYGITH